MAHLVSPIKDIAQQVGQLIGREINIQQAIKADDLMKQDKVWFVSYKTDKDELAAIVVMDISLACFSAAALSLLPAGGAEDAIKSGKLEGALYDNFYEVVNVLSGILSKQGIRFILDGIASSAEVQDSIKSFIANTVKTDAAELEVMGYGKGKMATFV